MIRIEPHAIRSTDIQNRLDRIDSLIEKVKRCYMNRPTLETLEQCKKIFVDLSCKKEWLIQCYESRFRLVSADALEEKMPEG